MAYDPTQWTNREVEKPRTYVMTDNGDGTITLTPSEGQVFAQGTPLDATNLNKMEEQIALNDSALAGKLDKAGGSFTGTLTGPTFNATSNLQEHGQNLNAKYQAKGDYAPNDQYVTWFARDNGVYLQIGDYSIALTPAQPPASAKRVWIQVDN